MSSVCHSISKLSAKQCEHLHQTFPCWRTVFFCHSFMRFLPIDTILHSFRGSLYHIIIVFGASFAKNALGLDISILITDL